MLCGYFNLCRFCSWLGCELKYVVRLVMFWLLRLVVCGVINVCWWLLVW